MTTRTKRTLLAGATLAGVVALGLLARSLTGSGEGDRQIGSGIEVNNSHPALASEGIEVNNSTPVPVADVGGGGEGGAHRGP